MNKDYVEINISIPLPIDKPNLNNVIFTEECIKNVCEQAWNIPIMNEDQTQVIGMTQNKPTYSNGFLNFDGVHWNNGFEFMLSDGDSYVDKNGVRIITNFKPCGYSFSFER